MLKRNSNKPPQENPQADGRVREHIILSGRVQGVGLRYRAVYAARSLDLTGWVENMSDGNVEMEVQGPIRSIGLFLERIKDGTFIEVTDTQMYDVPLDPGEYDFRVRGY